MNKPNIRVLLIEDNPGDVLLIEEILSSVGTTIYDLVIVDNLKSGVRLISSQKAEEDEKQSVSKQSCSSESAFFDAILLDLSLPDSDGLETFASIKDNSPELPIVILSGTDDERLATEAVKQGAQDYLVKGQIESNLLRRSIRYAIERNRIQRELNDAREQEKKELKSALASQQALMGWQTGSVTAKMSGFGPLQKRNPEVFYQFQSAYDSLLDKYIDSVSYQTEVPRHAISELASLVGKQAGGPRDVIELHRGSINKRIEQVSAKKLKSYTVDGRLLVMELLGSLVDYYRLDISRNS